MKSSLTEHRQQGVIREMLQIICPYCGLDEIFKPTEKPNLFQRIVEEVTSNEPKIIVWQCIHCKIIFYTKHDGS